MKDEIRDDDAFAERIAKPLRAPERADATFETRAMSAVRTEALTQRPGTAGTPRSWWRRSHVFAMSPLGALALAAGIAAVVVSAALVLRPAGGGYVTPRNPSRSAAVAAARRDTVYMVRFVFIDPRAREVQLVGEFNAWQKGATLLTKEPANGAWTVDVPLTPGRHEYAFVVRDEQGERWVADPLTETVHDDFGTESSIIAVGANASS